MRWNLKQVADAVWQASRGMGVDAVGPGWAGVFDCFRNEYGCRGRIVFHAIHWSAAPPTPQHGQRPTLPDIQ